ncbi:C4-dicarboxylate TRAP transporter substrate-binding protein [Gracilibacillus sp. D59]|uniref:C4-dicarboxylate TRAP transporter substrate-binding protein n=1 Tax=Gracilibacillus sp. D59 TaxID=3457434 RepID=UPI003FCCF436
MRKKQSFILIILCVVSMLVVSACSQESTGGEGESNGNDDKVYKLKIGTALTDSDPIYQGLVDFKEQVSERTDGKVEFEIFGSGSLGEDNDLLEQAKVGTNVAVLVDSGRLADMVPEIGILAAPYIVNNFDEANKVAKSDLFKEWSDKLAEEHNLKILSFNWYQGERHILANKPVMTPEDLKGVKLRTPDAPIWLETMKSMGATPAGMAWSEVYPAIQQGVIDGAEAQHPATYGAKLYEVISDISKTRHFQLITGLVTSDQWMKDLPKGYQEIILEEALKAGEKASHNTEDMLADFEQKMIDEGVEVHEVDVEPFKKSTEAVYDKFDGYQELREEIQTIIQE